MKPRKLLFLIFLVVAQVVGAQMMPTLPTDQDVRTGKLSNGLTYYIRYNNWPEHRAEFFIAQRVGSIQENEEQRGLAHFLEHMCFNGTEHFKGNNLIRYCESIGVKFGTDLNAYTSIDRTVYNISNVPTANKASLDSCLLILYDWANGLTLDPTEIDKERGVIHEEWRLRSSAQQRMLERSLPTLYPGSKYGLRMPIGLMSVIDNFKPQALRDYYEKWYRPDNQAIIVVGDVDVDHIEAKIKELFGGIELQANAAQVVDEPVPDNAEPIFVVEKDKEQQVNLFQIMFKQDVFPDSLKNTTMYPVANYVKNAAKSMLSQRLDEIALQPDCPFVAAGTGAGSYIFAKTKDAFTLQVVPKEGKTYEAITAVMCEALRAAQYGFTATEYARVQENTLSSWDTFYQNKDKRTNNQFCSEYVECYLENEPMTSIDTDYQLMKALVPQIPVEVVNEYIKESIPTNDSNLVVLNFNTEKEGAVYPTAELLQKSISSARTQKLEAYVDNVKNEPLISTLPQKGSIKAEKNVDKFDYKELTLSNGVKVLMKKTDFKKDEVTLVATGHGGFSLYGEKDYVNVDAFDDVIESSGLGNFSNTELRKALAGKIASCSMSLGERYQTISGSSSRKDMETMFQLVYLYFTNITKDESSFQSLMNNYEAMLKNKANNPDAAFQDSISVTMTDHNPRSYSMQLADLPKIDYDRILQIAKERTANAAAYRFVVIGDYDEEALRAMLEQYVASLPADAKKVEKGKKVIQYFKGIAVNNFKRKAETPKATAMMLWLNNNQLPYTLERSIQASMAGQVLAMIYLKKIREDAGAAYSCGAQGSFSKSDENVVGMIQAYCPMKPEKKELAIQIMRDEVPALAKTCDADMLNKVKEYMLKSHETALKTNGYWRGIINSYDKYGIDNHTTFVELVEKQTPATICAFMQEFLKANNSMEVIMLPEDE